MNISNNCSVCKSVSMLYHDEFHTERELKNGTWEYCTLFYNIGKISNSKYDLIRYRTKLLINGFNPFEPNK